MALDQRRQPIACFRRGAIFAPESIFDAGSAIFALSPTISVPSPMKVRSTRGRSD
jgi:hypothetical protein